MHININHVTREMWVTDEQGSVLSRDTAKRGLRMIDAASDFLTETGYMRTGDYLVVVAGSPMRRAKISPR